MSWIDDILTRASDLVQSIESGVCETTGLLCGEELSKQSKKIDKVELRKLPHVELKDLAPQKEPVVGCYIQMHQVGCYETFIRKNTIDPKKLEELRKKVESQSHQ
jgi:hypothetical protein